MKITKEKNRGITLVALVVTVIILLILAGISIAQLTGNGLFTKVQKAKNENEKQTATEVMNLKMTEIQIKSYAENIRRPTLQEVADRLCEDNEIEYVDVTSKKTGSIEKITVEDKIFTKLKAYSYEFEINSNLQLEAIDGIKIADSNTENDNGNKQENLNYSLIIKDIQIEVIPINSISINIKTTPILADGYTESDIATFFYIIDDEIKLVSKEKEVNISVTNSSKEFSIYVMGIDKKVGIKLSEIRTETKPAEPQYITEIGKSIIDGEYYEVIPDILTSNTSSEYVTVSASSELYTDSQAYRAFQKQDYVGWGSKNERGWLQLCFNTENKPIIKKIKFRARTLGSYINRDDSDHWQIERLTFEASNDGINWITLSTINSNPDGTYPIIEVNLDNKVAYQYYRFYNIDSEYGGLSNIHLYTY